MRILTTQEMREVDRRAIEELGIPGLVLMENAAIGVADALAERYPQATSVAIFCGPGNNGGDGLALARHLEARGYRLRVFLVLRTSRPRGDAAVELEILHKAGICVEEVDGDSDLSAVIDACHDADVLVDALFGTGLTRLLTGHFAALVERLDRLPQPCLAVDLPSGLDASRAELIGPSLRAELTVTFAAPKIAHIFAPAAERIGEVVVTDLGLPSHVVEEAPGDLHLLVDDELAACLLARQAADHKGDYGHVLLVAGSSGKAGAAILAARSAVRGGAGLVTAAVPEALVPTVDGGSLESMTAGLQCATEGGLTAMAHEQLLALAGGKQVVALGPGLGLATGTVDVVRRLVAELTVPVVLDADALNAFAGRLGELSARRHGTVLTPHPGEMARLLGTTSSAVQADRLAAAGQAARESGAVVVLKGHQSLIATPDGELHVNPSGNPGMASGGSGDVLTGLLAALIAQGYDLTIAAQLATFLHGLAGDLALCQRGAEGLSAEDLITALAAAFAQLRAA